MKKFAYGSCIALLAFLSASSLRAQAQIYKMSPQTLTRIKQEGFDSSKVMETLFQLTDVSGPRLTGSQGLLNAEEWARQQLSKWGLKNAKLERWGTFGRGWENRKCYVAMTAPYYQPLIAAPKAWTPGTNGLIASDVVLVKANSMEDLGQYHGKVQGKIVVIAPSSLDMRPGFKADARRLTDEDIDKLNTDPHVEEPADNAGGPTLTRDQLRALAAVRQKADSFLREEGALAIINGSRAGVWVRSSPAMEPLTHGTQSRYCPRSKWQQRM